MGDDTKHAKSVLSGRCPQSTPATLSHLSDGHVEVRTTRGGASAIATPWLRQTHLPNITSGALVILGNLEVNSRHPHRQRHYPTYNETPRGSFSTIASLYPMPMRLHRYRHRFRDSNNHRRLIAGDVLAADATGTAIAVSYSNGVLTLSSTDTLADYQAVLNTITFQSSSDNPTDFGAAATRTIEWVVTDLNRESSVPQTLTLSVNASNDAATATAQDVSATRDRSSARRRFPGKATPTTTASPIFL